jgi:hypothetical protein
MTNQNLSAELKNWQISNLANSQVKTTFLQLKNGKRGMVMKKNKLVMGLSLAILAGLWGGGVAHAVSPNASPTAQNNPGASAQAPRGPVDPVQSQNARQKMPLSQRKAAALRLRGVYQQQHHNNLMAFAQTQHGYNGQGQMGNHFGLNKTGGGQ